MNPKILPVLFLMMLLFSCQKEKIFENISEGTLLKQELIDGEIFREYTYNSAGFIREEKSKYFYSKHIYNNRNQIIQSDHYMDESILSSSTYVLEEALKRKEWVTPENTELDTYNTFEYRQNGELKEIATQRISGYLSYSTFDYNSQGKIERKTSYHEGRIVMVEDYYYDDIGNLISKKRYQVNDNGETTLSTTTEYEFDNMHNPYLSFRGLLQPGRNTNPNNILKEIYTIYFEVDDFIDNIQVTDYSYEYNSSGYPVSRDGVFEYIYY